VTRLVESSAAAAVILLVESSVGLAGLGGLDVYQVAPQVPPQVPPQVSLASVPMDIPVVVTRLVFAAVALTETRFVVVPVTVSLPGWQACL